VTLEPARVVTTEHVVDEAAQSERERGEQHLGPVDGETRLVADAGRAEQRASRFHDQQREHDEDPAGRRELVAAVVLTLQHR